MGQLAAQTGAAGEELEALGQIATQVYGAGFGENLESAAQGVATVRANTGLMGEDLKAAAQAGYLLSDVFDMDLAESSRAASALMNKFGLSAQEAYNLDRSRSSKGRQSKRGPAGRDRRVRAQVCRGGSICGTDDAGPHLRRGPGRVFHRQGGRRGEGVRHPRR